MEKNSFEKNVRFNSKKDTISNCNKNDGDQGLKKITSVPSCGSNDIEICPLKKGGDSKFIIILYIYYISCIFAHNANI